MSEELAHREVLNVRKSMRLGVPAVFAALSLCYFVGLPELARVVSDIVELSPSIRISVGLLASFIIIPLCIALLVISIFKAIPIRWKGVDLLVKFLNINIFVAAVFMIVGVPALTLLQYHYMPRLGYSKCNILRGHPNMWFNDWVRNPEWCVRGKDRAWVLEQAQRQTEGQGQGQSPRRPQ